MDDNTTPNEPIVDFGDYDKEHPNVIDVPDKKPSKKLDPSALDEVDGIRSILNDVKNTSTDTLINELFGGNNSSSSIEGLLDMFNLPSMTPEEMLTYLKGELNKLSDDDLEDMAKSIAGLPNSRSSSQSTGSANGHATYALNDASLLDSESFGRVKCVQDKDLYKKFLETYGTDSTKYLDDIHGILSFYMNDITAKLPLTTEYIKKLDHIYDSDKLILFYATPTDQYSFGFFVAVSENPDGDFSAFVPVFGNTFKYNPDTNDVSLYSSETDAALFKCNSDGTVDFKYTNLDEIVFSCLYILCPVKNVMLSPDMFGKITGHCEEVKYNGNYLQIGTIEPNGSPEAILFEKDADLETEQDEYPLYIKFSGKTKDKDALNALGDALNDCDWNNNERVKNSELQADTRGRVYFEVDLGEF